MRITPLLPLASLAAALASCGYSPLYAPHHGAAEAAQYVQVGAVSMGTIRSEYREGFSTSHNVGLRRVAQTVAKQLKLNFPAVGPEADTLAVTINETTSTLAVQRTAAIQRAQLVLTGFVTLTSADGKRLLTTSLNTAAPYNVENTPYSTESGKTYARLTAARNLADEISRRIALYYRMHQPVAR